MEKNPLLQLQQYGQSVWLDSLSRKLIQTGTLKQFIERDGLSGVTSNPAIFAKAIDSGNEYEADIRRLQNEGKAPVEIYEQLAISDIRQTADLLRPIFDRTHGYDGYVSLEVSPKLAHSTEGTIQEVKRLWRAVERPNVMIKIPATQEGVPAIEECTAEGININVTLLFGLPRYREVTEAYLRGLERRVERNEPPEYIRSVASFFLSRIDVLIDPLLEEISKTPSSTPQAAEELRGRVAIASAKIAYQIYKEVFESDRFKKLGQAGARKQWLLWGSTSTKTKGYSDTKYVEALIGPDTIDTMTPETMNAYRDHGSPALRIEQGAQQAQEVMQKLAMVGIDIDEMTKRLEDEAVEKFSKPFDHLMERLTRRSSGMPGSGAGQREQVGGSGVYPLSGPPPKGDAPIVPEPSWGQGQRGAAGYQESGGSELWFRNVEPEFCRDIMSKDPACCARTEVLETAARIMRDQDIGVVPVVEEMQSKKLIGLLTDRDIVVRAVSKGLDARTTRVEQIATRTVVTCSPDDKIERSLEAMEMHQVRRIPVVDNAGRVVGIISQADVAVRLSKIQQTGEVLQEISKPVVHASSRQ